MQLGLLAIAAALGLASSPSPAAELWLPLDRSTLSRILAEASDGDPPLLRSLDDILAEQRKSAQAAGSEALARAEAQYDAERKRLAPDTIWFLSDRGLPYRVAMAGNGEQVHSLRISVPVVRHGEQESRAAFNALAELFTGIYPDWPEAAAWPGESWAASWEASPLMRETPLENPDGQFIRHTAGGVTSTTYGVPPDIVVYEITVREKCIPSLAKGNPFKRPIC